MDPRLTSLSPDPTNSPLTEGRHVDDFGDRLFRTAYYAGPVAAGNIWQAKSTSSQLASDPSLTYPSQTCS